MKQRLTGRQSLSLYLPLRCSIPFASIQVNSLLFRHFISTLGIGKNEEKEEFNNNKTEYNVIRDYV